MKFFRRTDTSSLVPASDGRLIVRRLLSGGRDAWDRFAREYRRVVLKAVHVAGRRFRATEADIEDAAGQVFVELMEDNARVLRGFRGNSAFTTWLSVVAYRVATREFVRRVRAREVDATRPPPTSRPADADVLEHLGRLPAADRRVLVLFHLHDASYREISDHLEIPVNQVGMVLLRAREKLAAILKKATRG